MADALLILAALRAAAESGDREAAAVAAMMAGALLADPRPAGRC